MKLTGGLPAPSSWIGGVLVSAFRRRRLQKQGEDDQIPAQKRAHRATPETEMLFFQYTAIDLRACGPFCAIAQF